MANSLNFNPVNHNSTSQINNTTQNEQKSGGGGSGVLSSVLSSVSNLPFSLKVLGVLSILGGLAGATNTISPAPTITFASGNNSTDGSNGTTPTLATNSTTAYATTGISTIQTTPLPTSQVTNATSPATSPYTHATTQILNYTSSNPQTPVSHTNSTTPTPGHATTSGFTATATASNYTTTNGTIPTTEPDQSANIALFGIVGAFVLAGGAIGAIGYKLTEGNKQITIDLTPTGESVRAYNERLRVASKEIVHKFVAMNDSSDGAVHRLWDSLRPVCDQLSQVSIHAETDLDEEAQISVRDHDFGGIFSNYIYGDLVDRIGAVQVERCEESYKPQTGLQRYIQHSGENSMVADFIAGTKNAFTQAGTETINYILNKRA